jgi:hypothetical protein
MANTYNKSVAESILHVCLHAGSCSRKAAAPQPLGRQNQ